MKALRKIVERAAWSAVEAAYPGASALRDAAAEAVAAWEQGARQPLVVPQPGAPTLEPHELGDDTIIVDICDAGGRVVGTTTATVKKRNHNG